MAVTRKMPARVLRRAGAQLSISFSEGQGSRMVFDQYPPVGPNDIRETVGAE